MKHEIRAEKLLLKLEIRFYDPAHSPCDCNELIQEHFTEVEREAYEKAAQRIETMPTSMTKYQAANAIRKLALEEGSHETLD